VSDSDKHDCTGQRSYLNNTNGFNKVTFMTSMIGVIDLIYISRSCTCL